MEYGLIAILLLALVAVFVTRPLLAREPPESREAALREELEAARDAKYRQIREAELDFRAGKLTEADWRRIDRELRREAIELLRRLDELAPEPDPGGGR
jgi:hypothetical protein